ncbi:helix-turn-helix transcriptional regulator [Rhodococcus sp. 14C212]|uniref:helix-turn-helix domain-containing protein n=1 Tax=Rhodococcus sp. 14C212 TaxID=2711209 RepID=UPI0013EA6E09|nr:helix-turn-helix transcriptional regulator [Rhodococcus sp. 14C212]NGP06212.1 helix-turn-helix transcriptional regulator [Rhodococcus sp. 14C212]
MALLLREAIGDSLRRTRVSQSRTLREVSSSARVSLGYLSEIERGRKEASSELLAAICHALDVPLSDVLFDVSESLADAVPARGRTPVGAAASLGAEPKSRDSDALAAEHAALVAQDTRVVIPPPAARALAAA